MPASSTFRARVAASVLILFFILTPTADVRASIEVGGSTPLEASDVPVEVAAEAEGVQAVEDLKNAEVFADSDDEPSLAEAIDASPEELVAPSPLADVSSPEVTSESADVIGTQEEAPIASATGSLVAAIASSTASVTGGSEVSTETVGGTSTPSALEQSASTTAATTTTDALTTPLFTPLSPADEPLALAVPIEESKTPTSTAATTSDDEASSTPLIMTHTTDADRVSFGVTECVPVGKGTFHCVKREATTAEISNERVYSTRDEAGDLEIMLSQNGETIQISDNEYDDDAPLYDEEGEKIVWHSLINERYQIMSYDLETEETLRLTKGDTNSMQPATSDGEIVYQTWINDNWEIALLDDEGELTLLTENQIQDVAPSINTDYITWQSDEGGEWVVRIYNRKTEHIETVRGVEGGMVENPRMVLVFDNKKENGDIETVGYDPERGVTVQLAATPGTIPDRIPQPEHEKEEKALIQPTVTPRVETKATTTPSGGPEPETEDAASDVSIGTTTDITIESVAAEEIATTTTLQSEESSLILDLREATPVITPLIPDLVIPALDNETLHATGTRN